jgi:energy-converting hydrogenase Eha subunit H
MVPVADYREISQEYAKQGINAAFLLNGGAAVALLSQTAALREQGLSGAISTGMLIWAAGTVVAAVTWVLAFLSTRYVDKSEREPMHTQSHLQRSDAFMAAGLIAVLASIVLFSVGCWVLAKSLTGALTWT